MKIKIGTRGSELALWQTRFVADLLHQGGLETEIIIIETKGDKIQNQSLSKIGSKGLFTQELEEQLRNQNIDIAVHSAKDLQSHLEDDLGIIAFTEREKANDVLVSLNKNLRLKNLESSFLIGTSSTRRVALLKHYYPRSGTADVRGHLQTRFKKLENGSYDALILAYAGVKRMNFEEYMVEILPLDTFTPAVGQGTIAVEATMNLGSQKKELIRKLVNHSDTEICLLAERAFLKSLQGGCSIPIFALATLDNEIIHLNGGIISLDGKKIIRENCTGSKNSPEKIGIELAKKLKEAGAEEILQEIRQAN